MFLSTRAHPHSRRNKRVVFFMQSAISILFEVIVTNFPTNSGRIAFNIFVVSPLTIFINRSIYAFLVCPCLHKYDKTSI